MKKFAIVLFLISTSKFCFSQNGQWEWVKGNNGINQLGVYGTQGIPAMANVPGARESAMYWKDNAGNFWLFGGSGYGAAGGTGLLSDLWRYNPLTSEWTWMKGTSSINQLGIFGTQGTPSVTNNPGARLGAITWTDASGNFWMFGGLGYAAVAGAGSLDDLWRYNVSTNEWTWMKGNNITNQNGVYGTIGVANILNNPGARREGCGWTADNGNLWLFGGTGYAISGVGYLQDVWRYNIATNQWTWMKGNNFGNATAVYGTQGVPAAANTPGSRHRATAWKDFSGNFWLFGGTGYVAVGGSGELNDIWRFNSTTNTWTWMKGSNAINQFGIYGTLGVPAATNCPGSRFSTVSWTDPSGAVWIIGGEGLPAAGFIGTLNDQWKYNPATNNWSWEKGSQNTDQNGTYGTLGIPAPANISGGRRFSGGWIDYCGNLFLFGGRGYPGTGGADYLNDTWMFNNIAAPPSPTNTTPGINQTICSGNSATLMVAATASVTWFSSPTSTLPLGSGTTFVTSMLGAGNYTFYAENQVCTPSLNRTGITVTVNPTPTITASGGTICSGQSFTIVPSGALTYTFQGGSAVVSPTANSSYTIAGTSSLGCVSSLPGVVTITVNALPIITVNSGSVCEGLSFTINPSGANTYTYGGGGPVVSPTVSSSYSITGTDLNGCTNIIPAISNVSVTAAPIITVNSGSICTGGSFTMVPGGALSYTYSSGFAVVNPTISTSYSVTGTNTAGCVSVNPGISSITVVALPVISVSGGSVCLGSSFTLSPAGAQTYTFSSGNAVVTPTANTSYSITGTSSLGCINPIPVVCNVTVVPVPTISVTASGTFLCAGESATLSASGASTYSWSSGGFTPVEVVSPTITTVFTVTGTDANGCSSTAIISQSVDLCLDLSSETNKINTISIYPNPAKGKLFISAVNTDDLKIEIFSSTGQTIRNIMLHERNNEVQVENLSEGIYFTRIIHKGLVIKQSKLIIE